MKQLAAGIFVGTMMVMIATVVLGTSSVAPRGEVQPNEGSPLEVPLQTPFAKYTEVPQSNGVLPDKAILPDLEHVPIYPDARVVDAVDKSYISRWLTYITDADAATLITFYKDALPKRHWVAAHTVPDCPSCLYETYLWTDPNGTLPWHLELRISLSPIDEGGTSVTLSYGRYPDFENNLPMYPGAQQIESTDIEEPGSPGSGNVPARIITKTYRTPATFQEVEDFYNSIMPEYGWFFFNADLGPAKEPSGSITTEEGLRFRGNRAGTTIRTAVVIHLHISASPDQNNQIKVQLKAVITEIVPGH